MGITINYQGRLQDPASLPLLTAELQLACQRLGWSYHPIDERILGTAERYRYEADEEDKVQRKVETEPVDDHWRGLIIQPPECESLFLTFNRTGQLLAYESSFQQADTPGRYHVRELMWCKTQFGTIKTHIAICDLLRQVEPYMAEFEVRDEGEYWESGDVQRLAAALGLIDQMIGILTSEAGLKKLGEILGGKIERENVEIGKRLEIPTPSWRLGDRGISAGEN